MTRLLLVGFLAGSLFPRPAHAQCRISSSPASPIGADQPIPVYDAEPNNTALTANRAWLGTIANGAVYPNDIDYYAVDVPANTTLNLYAQVAYYGSPLWAKLTLFDRDGVSVLARQDSLAAPGDRGGRDAFLRHTVAQAGRYFVAISDSNATGTSTSWYSIRLFMLTPSPGDPVRTVRDGYQYVSEMKAGPGGLYILHGSTIERVRLDGTASVFATAPYNSGHMTFDGLGNLLVTVCSSPSNGAIWRFSQDGTRSVFADSLPGRTKQIAVGPDGDVWVCFENKLLRFDPAGGLRDTVVTDYRLWYTSDLAFAPNGDLLLASYNGVYRVRDATLQPVIPDGHSLVSLAFDRDGNLYAGQGRGFPGGVTLYDAQYHLLNDPLARVDSQVQYFWISSLSFSPNDDGSMSRRLFALYRAHTSAEARIVELNPQGVRAPGVSIAPPVGRIELGPLPDATAGEHYTARLHTANGTTGSWMLSTGNVPAGLALSSNGELSGTAPPPGLYSFTVRHTSGSAVAYASVSLRVNVGAAQLHMVWETELNNTRETANSVAMLDTINGSVSQATDQDWYAVDLRVGQQVHIGALSGSKLSVTLQNETGYPYAVFRPTDSPDELDTNLWIKAPASGRFLVQVQTSPPSSTPYRLIVDSAPVPQGPGDPTRNLANVGSVGGMVAGHNELWVAVGDRIDRVDANGVVSTLATIPSDQGRLNGGIALDTSGNLLVVTDSIIWRIAPNGARTEFARTSYNSPGITVGPDGDIWVGGSNRVRRFTAAGLLKDSVWIFGPSGGIPCPAIAYLAFSPAGELHYAGECPGLYKLDRNTTPKRVLYFPTRAQAPVFDRDGYLYLVNGLYLANGENSKVVLYDPTYHTSKDPFSTDIWHDTKLTQLVFWRDASGYTTDRLFAIGGGRVVELNRSGIRAPGWPIGKQAGSSTVTVTLTAITTALMGGPSLSAAQVQFLDTLGNHNGVLDVGDLRAYLRAQGKLSGSVRQ